MNAQNTNLVNIYAKLSHTREFRYIRHPKIQLAHITYVTVLDNTEVMKGIKDFSNRDNNPHGAYKV